MSLNWAQRFQDTPHCLSVFVVFRHPMSRPQYYIYTNSIITITSYVDEHYQHELKGVFAELGLA